MMAVKVRIDPSSVRSDEQYTVDFLRNLATTWSCQPVARRLVYPEMVTRQRLFRLLSGLNAFSAALDGQWCLQASIEVRRSLAAPGYPRGVFLSQSIVCVRPSTRERGA